ncbi:MAG: TonB-dependent receptor [Flavihumibacter sp.]
MKRKRTLSWGIVLLMMLCAFTSYAQTRIITGTITDEKTAQPIAGATVSVKGTGNASVTDSAGKYRLSVPESAQFLEISSVGYTNRQVAVTGIQVDAALAVNAGSLEGVVVIGYGSARKKDLTGAVASVSAAEFQKGSITTPEQLISGKVAGVAITSNGGRPGEGSTIRIRGGSSLLASNDPLIVIDGVPLDNSGISGAANPLSFINPNDIESYTILKDASSAAIYGSRANNGVIIITTKKGKTGALKVNFLSTNSLSHLSKELDVLNAAQVRQVVNEYGTDKQQAQLGTANTNWQDVIYQTAFASDNNLSISGGIKKLPFRLSLGYLTQSGILRTDKMDRQSVGLSLSPSFFDRHLKVDINFKGSAQQTRFANSGAIGSAITFDPTQPVYSDNKTYGGYYQWLEADGSLVLNRNNNPLAQLEQTFDKQKPMRGIGNIQLDYKFHFLPALRANVNLGYDGASSTGTRFVPAEAATDFLNGGSFTQAKQTRRNTVFDAYLNYASNIGKHRVDATVGYSYNNFRTKTYNFRALNANKDTIAGTTAPATAYDIPENTIMSYFGRLLYNYNSRYFITASLRRDGSSRFSSANRWGWFPSVGVAWSIKNDVFKHTELFSELKLRAGYGLTGQQDGIGNYDYIQRYGIGNLSTMYQLGNTFYQPYTPYGFNANLKWEKLSSYNVALDFGFLNGRINGSLDFYLRDSKDLLNSVPQPTGTNFSAYVLANVGSLRNKGVEFTLNTTPVQTSAVSLDLNFNATYNQNRITNLTVIPDDPNYAGLPTGSGDNGVNGFLQLHQVGYSRNTFYLYQQAYDANGQPIEGLFVDRNRDGQITAADKYLNHSAAGDWMFGFSSNLSVKKWNAGFTMRSSLNNYVYNNIHSTRAARNQVLGNYIINNASSYYLETRFKGGVDIQPLSDLYVENASFLRMDNLFVGYNFGKVIRKKVSMRATASVQNVFVVTRYTGLDPEVGNGIDNSIYPRPRIFALSLNFDF